MNPKIRQNVLPVAAALIWGLAFVAQSVGSDYIGPFTFNAVRFYLGAIVLIIFLAARKKFEKNGGAREGGTMKAAVKGGIVCGICLAVAANLQQMGVAATSAGKAGFITTLYIVIVPIFGVILKRKVPVLAWVSVPIAAAGLYLLCVTDSFTIETADIYLLVCALTYAVHIMVIDKFSVDADGVELSCVQFITAGTLSGIVMLFTEQPTMQAIIDCAVPLLYVGIFSSGVAYTLQVIAQKGTDPVVVSLLLSLESVFSVIFGAIILHETMTAGEYLGCVLMLVAVVLVQLPVGRGKSTEKLKAN